MKVLFFYRECESLGVEYLMSALKKAGHKYYLLFDSGTGEIEYEIKPFRKIFNYKEKMLDIAKYYKPDLIVFSSVTNLFPWVSEIGKSLKKIMKVPIIVGGIHPTIVPEYVINHDFVDMICIGEGEQPIVDLVNSMESGSIDHSIRNIWFKDEEGKIIKNPCRPLLDNLDSLSFPDKELFYQYGAFSVRYYIISGRGCPNNCTYCVNHQLKDIYKGLGRYVRKRSVKNVIEELKIAKSKYKFEEIYFYDDLFVLDDNWLEEFSQTYPKEVGIKFKCLMHPNFVTLKRIQLLKKAGCFDIDIGLESGDVTIRKQMLNRSISDGTIINSINMIKNSGIGVSTLNLIGIPGEKPREMYKTFLLNAKLKPKGVLINELYPFPKTKIFDIFKEYGLINEKNESKFLNGKENYRTSNLIDHPYSNFMKRIQILAPIAVKFPKIFQKFILRLPPISIMRILSIFTITSPYNTYIKLKEFLITLIKTYVYYQKNQIKSQKIFKNNKKRQNLF